MQIINPSFSGTTSLVRTGCMARRLVSRRRKNARRMMVFAMQPPSSPRKCDEGGGGRQALSRGAVMRHGAVGTIDTESGSPLHGDVTTQAGDLRRARIQRKTGKRQSDWPRGYASHELVSVRTLDSLS
ncbi:hypothetical protein [Burkholderia pyrrocinia]|uniref:hypothetical protein n=1 Tax=Burkholderia pyrrocinia TaxID=60550 RepID=UPI001BCF675B|nr:hypothetical protein [Burkholderia pyrrocinia]QVN20906.1 hypothetical protein JYG32_30670 [Burkholderia pyrrocinia]